MQFFVTPGYGDTALAALHYSQAVRIGDTVRISGQGGWDDDFTIPESLEAEIVRAFDNVQRTLAEAGAGWPDVVAVDSFHVVADHPFDEHNKVVVEEFRRRMGDRAPIWTQVGVTALGLPAMRIEIKVTAELSR